MSERRETWSVNEEMTDRLDVEVNDGTGGEGVKINEAFERLD